MTTKLTPGRLFNMGGELYAENIGAVACYEVAIIKHRGSDFTPGVMSANAERLAACWNACDGISTDDLDFGAPLRMRLEASRNIGNSLQLGMLSAQQQRDYLLARLRDMVADTGDNGDHFRAAAAAAIEACATMALPDDDQHDQPTEATP